MNGRIDVSYFDSVNGGAGQLGMDASELIEWLNGHPGFLIRKIWSA